ncbi:MAG: hypothetical protein E7555_09455 [Ruminococcaceae bacterium]|nr:hypothetical protein [Oscillospiraceae bacterium]
MTEKEKAAICLFCTEPECKGEAKCFKERQKEYIKKCNAERRKGEQALNYICNVQYSKSKREARKKALNCRLTVERTGDEQVEAVTKR